jgi:hypothetical protein
MAFSRYSLASADMEKKHIGGSGHIRPPIRPGLRRVIFLAAIPLFLIMPRQNAFPATLLLAVCETVDSEPGQLPPPATEGLFDALFEAGHIVFNTRDGAEIPPKAELLALAVSGGAGFVLEVSVEYTRTQRAEGFVTVDAAARFNLFAALSGDLLASGVLSDSNRGSEKDVNLFALGFRLGERVASEAFGGSAPAPRTVKKSLE